VPEHGVDQAGVALADDIPVLAEIMRDKGYRALYVAANPTMSKKSGLERGFEHSLVSENLTAMRGKAVGDAVDEILDNISEDDKLFLFVNILDAHDPYPAIPEGVGWADPQDKVVLNPTAPEQDEVFHRYLRGELNDTHPKNFLRRIRNAYDYGVLESDRALEHVMRVLRQNGRLKDGYRVVITSDHGEFLGEHNLLRHGCYTWEPVVKVPLVFHDTRIDGKTDLPEPFSGIDVFHLVADGKVPDTPTPAKSFSKARIRDVRGCANMATHWASNTDKLVWMEGETFRFDLDDDPGELTRLPLGDVPGSDYLRQIGADHAAHVERTPKIRPDRLKELEALGYIE
jgi:arylsulfatase A-like enzyme